MNIVQDLYGVIPYEPVSCFVNFVAVYFESIRYDTIYIVFGSIHDTYQDTYR